METPPILFIIFNRPDITRITFEKIREFKPTKLFISADGPRRNHSKDAQLCWEARKVKEGVDWDCELKTRYLKHNLGCAKAVSSAVDWFFGHEEEGIILEDDCIPDYDFFNFCSSLLDNYREDTRVFTISGANYLLNSPVTDYSYHFSKYFHSWGWATWRRAWQKFDFEMKTWPEVKEKNLLLNVLHDQSAVDRWEWQLDMTKKGYIDSWAYRFCLSSFINHGLHIVPKHNLIKNIGFDTEEATHTRGASPFAELETYPIEQQLHHPPYVIVNQEADELEQDTLFGRVNPFRKRLRAFTNRLHNLKYRLTHPSNQ